MVDGFTQTTLKKGSHIQRSDSGVSSDCSMSLTSRSSPSSHLLSTDVCIIQLSYNLQHPFNTVFSNTQIKLALSIDKGHSLIRILVKEISEGRNDDI